MNKNSSTSFAPFLVVVSVPTLVYVAALLFDSGRTLVLWERVPLDLGRVLPLAAGLSAYSALCLMILRRLRFPLRRYQVAALLTWAFFTGCALQVAAVYIIEVYPLRSILIRELSSLDGGYWTVGTRVHDVGQFLASYADIMSSFPVHPQRHPPGLPLFFWSLTKLAEGLPSLSSSVGPLVRPLSCFDDQAAWLNNA